MPYLMDAGVMALDRRLDKVLGKCEGMQQVAQRRLTRPRPVKPYGSQTLNLSQRYIPSRLIPLFIEPHVSKLQDMPFAFCWLERNCGLGAPACNSAKVIMQVLSSVGYTCKSSLPKASLCNLMVHGLRIVCPARART